MANTTETKPKHSKRQVLAAFDDFSRDWTQAEILAYHHNVEVWLNLGRSADIAHALAQGMVQRSHDAKPTPGLF